MRRIKLGGPQLAGHIGIAETFELEQLVQTLESERREALRLDRAHVPARAFDPDGIDRTTRDVGERRLGR